MRAATISDESRVIELIVQTFNSNPTVSWMLRNSGNRSRALRHFSSYIFSLGLDKKGVYLSRNEKGVVIMFRSDCTETSFRTLSRRFRMAITTLRLKRIPALLRMERYRKLQRPNELPYLYVWFMGVLPDGGPAAIELKNGILKIAQTEALPVYAETSVSRNRPVFERMGFKTYHHWKVPGEELEFWFMKGPVVGG